MTTTFKQAEPPVKDASTVSIKLEQANNGYELWAFRNVLTGKTWFEIKHMNSSAIHGHCKTLGDAVYNYRALKGRKKRAGE